MDYIVLSIPVFFILIGVEVLISYLKRSNLYQFDDAITNISCGVLQQISGVFFKTLMILGYKYLFDHYRLVDLNESIWMYALLFVGIDFFYYWFHRYAHEVSVFWGTHIVHHQSEEYNFSVALRQSALQGFVAMFFYLPLAFIGFHPAAFVTMSAFQTLYQFWIHTKTINKLHPAFEFVFNTPSHHRVHHGRNPKYIDKNHGGTLIIFDRLFGTFQAEEEEVVYGVTKPLASWNPLWANIDYYADLWRDLQRPMSFGNKVKMLFMKPGWLPESEGGYRAPQPVSSDFQKFTTHVSVQLNYYVLFQYVILLVFASTFLFNLDLFTIGEQLMISFFVLISIVSFGILLEGKSWGKKVEGVRLILLVGIVYLIVSAFI